MKYIHIFWRGCEKLVAALDTFDVTCLKLASLSGGILIGLAGAKRHRTCFTVLAALVIALTMPLLMLKFIACLCEAKSEED